MRAIVVIAVCAALVALPVKAQAPEKEPEVTGQIILQCLYGVLIIGTVAGAGYIIHKCREAAENTCHNCDTEIKADETECSNCGEPFRCEDCNTELPPDAEKCPACETRVPPRAPAMKSLQMSADGVNWETVVPAGSTTFSGVTIKAFGSQEEFNEWLGSQSGITRIEPVTVPQGSGFFRLSN